MLPETIRTLATFAPLELGDTILATPLYRAAASLLSEAHFTLLSQLPNHPVLEDFGVFDSIENYHLETDLSAFDLVVLPVLCGDSEVRSHFASHSNVISADRLYAGRRNFSQISGTGSTHMFSSISTRWSSIWNWPMKLVTAVNPPRHIVRKAIQLNLSDRRERLGCVINTPTNEFQAMANRQWPIEN